MKKWGFTTTADDGKIVRPNALKCYDDRHEFPAEPVTHAVRILRGWWKKTGVPPSENYACCLEHAERQAAEWQAYWPSAHISIRTMRASDAGGE